MVFEHLKKTKDQIFERLQADGEEVASKVSDISRQGVRKTVSKLLNEFEQFAPHLEAAGFIIGDIELRITIPPAPVVTLEQAHDNVSDRLAQLTEEIELTTLQRSVVKIIKEAYLLEDVVTAKGHVIGQFDLTFSLPPSVSIHLNSNRSRVFKPLEEKV